MYLLGKILFLKAYLLFYLWVKSPIPKNYHPSLNSYHYQYIINMKNISTLSSTLFFDIFLNGMKFIEKIGYMLSIYIYYYSSNGYFSWFRCRID